MSSVPFAFVTLLGLLASLVLRGDPPPGGSPFAVVLDLALRLLTGILLASAVAFAAVVEVTQERWLAPDLAFAALLGGWALAAIAGSALLHRWQGMRASLLATEGVGAAGVAHGSPMFLFVSAIGMAAGAGNALLGLALSGAASDLDAAARTLTVGAAVVGLALAVAAYGAVRVAVFNDTRLWDPSKLARALHGAPGSWTIVRVSSPAAPAACGSFRVFVHRGRWYWLVLDMRRLRALRAAAIASAERPAMGLHTHRMTFVRAAGRGATTAAWFGVRVWDPVELGWQGRWRAHRAERFDDGDYEGLPDVVRGRLVPLSPATLEAAGLQALPVPGGLELPAVEATGSRTLLPA